MSKPLTQPIRPSSTGKTFDVTRLHNTGKIKQHQLTISREGVKKLDNGTMKWFVPNTKILSINRTAPTSTTFSVSVVMDYNFEGESPERVDEFFKMVEEWKLNKPKTIQANDEDDDFELIDANEETSDKKTVTSPSQESPRTKPKPVEPPMSRLDVPLGLSLAASANTVSLTDFEILAMIGKGSFGTVYQVKKKSNGKIYAMKTLNKYDLYQRDQNFHTLTERTILATIHHSFMPKLYYAFQTQHKLYMVIDYANGGEMFFHLQRAGSFPDILATFYIAEICLVISHLHNNNIVFRDLKPENVLIDSDGHLLLTDYGLAKIGVTAVGGFDSEGFSTQTFCGTPEYLAPEILKGIPHGKAVDWWSVGVMYYEMLCGSSPFYSPNRNQMYQNTLAGPLIFPDSFSSHQRDFISSLLNREPKDRLGSSPNGATDVLSHPVFAGLDLTKLAKREITPPYKPKIDGTSSDTTNVNPNYLAQAPVDSPPSTPSTVKPHVIEKMNSDFVGFDFNFEMVNVNN
ncbi:putative protein kinase [Blattamonas nauphoetae]|uniref:Uncharacterized protein n=1 Tax=Blattamonas nauphoetae TaxID=2049346 RepID=A0ABQ9XJB6_9EUKA|nr:putative protein kinase [Blattamonas nauphoetae]